MSDCVRLDRSDFWGRRLPTPRPGRPPADPGRGCQIRGALAWPPPPASSRSGNISCPRPHPQLPGGSELASRPGQRSQLPQLASQTARAGEGPVWLREAVGEPKRPAPSEVAREPQGSGKARANWQRAGTPLPFLALPARLRGCPGAAGLSRRCLPTQLPMLASQPVPHAPEAAVGRLLHAAAPNRGVPGSTTPAARHRELLDLPWGALCPTPASPQTLRASGEGGGQARGARDSARPETSPAGGAEGGGGHRRSYSRITPSSQLGPAPRSLSLTCLTPPRPGPAPFLPLGVAAPRSPAAPGAHVTDGTAPRAGSGFLIGFSQDAYRPSAPPSQVPALSPVSRGERPGIMRPQPPRLRARQSLPLPEPRPGPGPALWGGAVRSLKGLPGPEPAGT